MESWLDELRRHWGDAYAIDAVPGGYRAVRRDGRGTPIERQDIEDLWTAIRADYDARPVPR